MCWKFLAECCWPLPKRSMLYLFGFKGVWCRSALFMTNTLAEFTALLAWLIRYGRFVFFFFSHWQIPKCVANHISFFFGALSLLWAAWLEHLLEVVRVHSHQAFALYFGTVSMRCASSRIGWCAQVSYQREFAPVHLQGQPVQSSTHAWHRISLFWQCRQ